MGRPWICTQNFILVNRRLLAGTEASNCWKRTTCLSKDHGSFARTRSASVSSSKTNKSTWSQASHIVNSYRDLQRVLKVRPTASTLRALLVKNLAASTYSLLFQFLDFDKLIFLPSTSVKESFFQSLRISSMEQEQRGKKPRTEQRES